MSTVDSMCPHCGKETCFTTDLSGTVQSCPYCFETLVLPMSGSGPAAVLPLPIETQRLVLTRLAERDLPDLYELFREERIFEFLETYPATDEEDVRTWFEAGKNVRLGDPGGHLDLAARTGERQTFIGLLSFYFVGDEQSKQEHRQGWFTVMVKTSYWGRGYGTEMVQAIMRFGFIGIGLRGFRVGVDSRNSAACRMLERAGLRREGEFLEYKYTKGRWTDTTSYALLAREYREGIKD